MIRAKFKVVEITERKHWDEAKPNIKTIKLQPVNGGSRENEAFYAASPSGSIELGTVNADAAGAFTLGQEYYIDFTPAARAPAEG